MSAEDELPPQQRAILEGLASGLSVKELAFKTGLTVKSVDSHRYRLMKRLGLRGRIELTRFAIEKGIVPVMDLDETPEPYELTDRQREVVTLTGDGLSVKEMAELLQISPRSADAHKHRAMHRLDLHDAVRLVHYCVRHHLKAVELIESKQAHEQSDDSNEQDGTGSDGTA